MINSANLPEASLALGNANAADQHWTLP